MKQSNKFNTFAGVFTPSVLTILGVIMYMRLGWVVGEAGLIYTIAIIVIAHIISITTGLSISSIATDKKIKAGGIYYILSRSLGLPMGGAIGIALFIGTALSISLYLIGFAESFLSIEPLRDFLGLAQDINSYRIVGTASIVILVIIAFISTSLAIKTQYYILGAIALSLVSIAVGFFTNTQFSPDIPSITVREGVSLELVFAIFFPAVTGFTAGVAMSGDLKDPKKSIPRGTLSAIAVGFIIYISLAVGLAYFVDRDLLLNDTNFLLKVAWFSPLVIAGIWGATLSSALGGILGGPRIIQAVSADKITPKIFAKGYGAGNEPRNALILIFFIAEGGILIGELNMIAGIVSMFYLASYGFINLAYYLESWSNTDFRPSFSINRYIALIGFIASFGVMFKLDMMAMFAALIILWGIYFILQRKQMKSNYGDVWTSVWSTVLRTALKKIDTGKAELKNWKPNIILFSGGTNKRPYLVQFGRAIVGKYGMLSNFDLIEQKDAKILFPKHKKALPGEIKDKGVFFRRQTVKDLYEGVETIASTYGFSGVEPNTLMMGWTKHTKDPQRFFQMLESLDELDYNILLLDYDKEKKFGNYKSIDIWWEGEGNQGHFALTLSKFLLMSDEWKSAQLRLLIINQVNNERDTIYRKVEKIMDNLRINIEIYIINNELEQKSFFDIVSTESKETDLIFLPFPELKNSDAKAFIQKTNLLLENTGTTALLYASSYFKKLNTQIQKSETPTLSLPQTIELPEIIFPKNKSLSAPIEHFHSAQNLLLDQFTNNHINVIFSSYFKTLDSIENLTLKIYNQITESKENLSKEELQKKITQESIQFLDKLGDIIKENRAENILQQKENLSQGIQLLLEKTSSNITAIPSILEILLRSEDLQTSEKDENVTKKFKASKQRYYSKAKITKGISYKLKLRALIQGEYEEAFYQSLNQFENSLGSFDYLFTFKLKKLINSIIINLHGMQKHLSANKLISEQILNAETKTKEAIRTIQETNQEQYQKIIQELLLNSYSHIESSVLLVQKIPANHFIKKSNPKQINHIRTSLQNNVEKWSINQQLLFNESWTETQIFILKSKIQELSTETLNEINDYIHHNLIDEIDERLKLLHKLSKDQNPEKLTIKPLNMNFALLKGKIVQLIENITQLPSLLNKKFSEPMEFISLESKSQFENIQFGGIETQNHPISKHLTLYLQQNFIIPLQQELENLPILINQKKELINDRLRLLELTVNHQNSREEHDLDNFFQKQREDISTYHQNILSLIDKINQDFLQKTKNITDELSLSYLLRHRENIHKFKKTTQISDSWLHKTKEIALKNWQKSKEQFWYKQSKALLYAQDITSNEQQTSILSKLLQLREKSCPKAEVLNLLPFYYKQLFLKPHHHQQEFWHGRAETLQQAQKTIQWYQEGHNGGILITGNRYSGKSFLAHHIIDKFLPDSTTFIIQAPLSGSINTADFLKNIQEATGIKSSLKAIMSQIASQSVFLIDNFELWWEKSQEGNKNLHFLIDLIKNYGDKHLFVVNINAYSYKVMREISSIDNYFLNILNCNPMNAEELKEILLFRHRSGSLQMLSYKDKNEITPSSMAEISAKYFLQSRGNVGIALQQWISNIVEYKEEKIYIKVPQNTDTSFLNDLSPETLIYLVQFTLHRQLNKKRLKRITQNTEENVSNQLQYLIRAGLIDEISEKVYHLNPCIYPHVLNLLKTKELI